MTGERALKKISVRGVVQGVGFRPFVYKLARERGLAGYVANTSDGVEIEVEGPPTAIEAFLADLQRRAPPLSFISEVAVSDVAPQQASAMEIRPSQVRPSRAALIP